MVKRILDLMKKLNLTAYQVSKYTGINNNAISSWKLNKARPNVEAVTILANYFGVTTDYLITGKDNEIVLKQLKENNNELQQIYDELDFVNKNKLLGYADGLLQNQKLTKKEKTN